MIPEALLSPLMGGVIEPRKEGEICILTFSPH